MSYVQSILFLQFWNIYTYYSLIIIIFKPPSLQTHTKNQIMNTMQYIHFLSDWNSIPPNPISTPPHWTGWYASGTHGTAVPSPNSQDIMLIHQSTTFCCYQVRMQMCAPRSRTLPWMVMVTIRPPLFWRLMMVPFDYLNFWRVEKGFKNKTLQSWFCQNPMQENPNLRSWQTNIDIVTKRIILIKTFFYSNTCALKKKPNAKLSVCNK